MLRFLLIILVFEVNGQKKNDSDDMKLEFVQTLWRHGDRAALFPLYPIFESNWTFGGGGFGQLTPLGMAQMKDLGALYRKIYVEDQEFLSHRYIGKEIYIRSTNVNRTIVSALSMLYGLFPPGAWNIQGVDYPNTVNWQQGFTFVPLHIDDQKTCITSQQCDCERFNLLQDKWAELPEAQTANAKMLALNRKMAALYNITKDQDTFNDYADAWKCQRNWFNDTLYKDLSFYNEDLYSEALTTFAPIKRFMEGYFMNSSIVDGLDIGHETTVIQSGDLINELFDRAQLKANCIKSGQNCTGFFQPLKFYGYSSHDLVIFGLLVSLGVPEVVKTLDGWPDTGAALNIELYSNPDLEFFIKFLYRDNSEDDFEDLTSKVCNRSPYCSLGDFEKLARNLKPLPDFDTLCATPLSSSSSTGTFWLISF
uniref:Acid phosphatase n=1 Tax=Caenorhabditis tropicalis TaxID=1561998 RepID=A0A1I7U4S1_9PELO